MYGSPRGIATGVAAGSWDLGTAVSDSTLRRIGERGRPSQPLSRRFKISYNPQNPPFFFIVRISALTFASLVATTSLPKFPGLRRSQQRSMIDESTQAAKVAPDILRRIIKEFN